MRHSWASYISPEVVGESCKKFLGTQNTIIHIFWAETTRENTFYKIPADFCQKPLILALWTMKKFLGGREPPEPHIIFYRILYKKIGFSPENYRHNKLWWKNSKLNQHETRRSSNQILGYHVLFNVLLLNLNISRNSKNPKLLIQRFEPLN